MSGKSSNCKLYVTVSVALIVASKPVLCANVIVFPFSTVSEVVPSLILKLVTGCVPAVTAVICPFLL